MNTYTTIIDNNKNAIGLIRQAQPGLFTAWWIVGFVGTTNGSADTLAGIKTFVAANVPGATFKDN